ncbi:GL18407 [Drosophila persimilis]|uniref:GL18407 n=1 Tax=Drosophila persimilis TaxID=7234 RepID=B4HCS5_DROPE|nr:GL18407 [Drosophila persimilis]
MFEKAFVEYLGSYHLSSDAHNHTLAHHEDLDTLVRSFMDMERVQPSNATIDACDPTEQHFVHTHTRRNDGLYIVQYPFKDSASPMGATLPQALRRFSSLERKFRKFPALKVDSFYYRRKRSRQSQLLSPPHSI